MKKYLIHVVIEVLTDDIIKDIEHYNKLLPPIEKLRPGKEYVHPVNVQDVDLSFGVLAPIIH